MNAKHDWKLLEGSIPDEERPQKEVQEDEEEVMECYIKVEGCENGYIVSLVEVSDDFRGETLRWVATTTADMKKVFENVIDDIRREGVE